MTRRVDLRLRALLITGIATVAIAAAVMLMPASDGTVMQVTEKTSGLASNTGWDAAAHVNEKQDAEIRERFNQATLMLHAKRYDHALTALHRVLELAPQMPEAHVNMGFAMLGLNRHSQARDFFESAIELRPSQVNAYYGLAVALEGGCEFSLALGAMRTYIHLSQPEDPFLRKARAAVWEWEGRADNETKGAESSTIGRCIDGPASRSQTAH